MDIKVYGEQVLNGEITPSGSKNSAVALIPATILFNKPVTLCNIPDITDVARLVTVLENLGSKVTWDKDKKELFIDNSNINFNSISKGEVGNMRGVSLLWGPMLSRFGKVSFEELPGGCTLGVRPLDPHYDVFRDLGVEINLTGQSVSMDAKNAKATTVWLTEMSPTVTENAIMLSVLLKGKTTIIGAASEPGVQDLCHLLNQSGAKISGIGSSVIEIEGVSEINPPKKYEIYADHYEIATFLALGAITGGEIRVKNSLPDLFVHINRVFAKFNINIEYEGTTAIVRKNQNIKLNIPSNSTLQIKAQPWPSLPVDILPLFIPIALMAKSGNTLFHNWMYESGLFWTSELTKFGANVIMADPHRVIVNAGNKLNGAKIEAPYIIRAVVAMAMCAMTAKGESLILNADALYRGHPNFSLNLKKLGAKIEEVN
ncbi:UDP-N-acetylglucosamine 1-carboxyvinyltransferase [Candidatus Dojkabacteria bacterium]|nr:UDP-N-acetylglucosamine 1-carboxyvinyltransferase [Candidatus Dojkabacteria bacterium]